MTFSVPGIIVTDKDDKVVALDWSYENSDGKISNRWTLLQPYGNMPLAECTEAILVGWLEEQLPNNTLEFDRQIADAKARQDFAQTLKPYVPHEYGPPTPVPNEPPAPAPPAPEVEGPGTDVEEPEGSELPVTTPSKTKSKKPKGN